MLKNLRKSPLSLDSLTRISNASIESPSLAVRLWSWIANQIQLYPTNNTSKFGCKYLMAAWQPQTPIHHTQGWMDIDTLIQIRPYGYSFNGTHILPFSFYWRISRLFSLVRVLSNFGLPSSSSSSNPHPSISLNSRRILLDIGVHWFRRCRPQDYCFPPP